MVLEHRVELGFFIRRWCIFRDNYISTDNFKCNNCSKRVLPCFCHFFHTQSTTGWSQPVLNKFYQGKKSCSQRASFATSRFRQPADLQWKCSFHTYGNILFRRFGSRLYLSMADQYEWFVWTDIPGATILSYSPHALTATSYYRIAATDGGTPHCGSVYSGYVMITVNPLPTTSFIYHR